MNYTNLQDIEAPQVECYRGNDGFTTVYMKNGDVHYVKEDFETVDEFLGL